MACSCQFLLLEKLKFHILNGQELKKKMTQQSLIYNKKGCSKWTSELYNLLKNTFSITDHFVKSQEKLNQATKNPIILQSVLSSITRGSEVDQWFSHPSDCSLVCHVIKPLPSQTTQGSEVKWFRSVCAQIIFTELHLFSSLLLQMTDLPLVKKVMLLIFLTLHFKIA